MVVTSASLNLALDSARFCSMALFLQTTSNSFPSPSSLIYPCWLSGTQNVFTCNGQCNIEWSKITFPSSFCSSLGAKLFPPNLLPTTVILVTGYFGLMYYPPLFRQCAIYLRLYYQYLVKSRVIRLGAACFAKIIFVSSFMLIDCRRFVRLH